MNWIIQSDFNEFEELSRRENLTEYEKCRIEELEASLRFYQTEYSGGN